MSLMLHVVVLSAAMVLRINVQPTIPPEPFHWQVSLVEPPPPVPVESAPVRPTIQAQSSPVPAVTHSETMVERRPVRRAMAEVRTIQPRTLPPVESRAVTRDPPTERTPAVETAPAVVHSAGRVRHMQAIAQERAQGSVEAIETAVQAMSSPISTHQTIVRREVVADDQRTEAVQDHGSVGAAADSLRHRAPIQDQRQAVVEMVQVQPVDLKQPEAVISNVQSVGQVRPHYGWLKADLMTQIERMKRYPQFALDNRWEGRVVVRAVIRADGQLLELSVVESSGHELLDRESLELLRRLSPVPLKHPLGAPQVTLRIPINYGIH